MPRLARLLLPLGLAALVAACQAGLPGSRTVDDVTPNAVAGDPIEVTALDAPSPAVADTEAPATETAATPDATDPAAAPSAAPSADGPAAASATDPEGVAAALPVEPEVPQAIKTEAQIACENRDGLWTPVGTTGTLRACVFQTRDGGERCSRESDCEGACLARSGTCSPIRPLFGCHEVLQNDGRRVTLCID